MNQHMRSGGVTRCENNFVQSQPLKLPEQSVQGQILPGKSFRA
ncbi:hypothetical protein [Paenibacillus sp. 1P03SA]